MANVVLRVLNMMLLQIMYLAHCLGNAHITHFHLAFPLFFKLLPKISVENVPVPHFQTETNEHIVRETSNLDAWSFGSLMNVAHGM